MALHPGANPAVLHDEAYVPIDSVTIAAVVRLAVHAIVGAGGVFDETADDNAVAQGDTLLEVLNLPYVNNGTGWIRAQGGSDNAAVGAANQGQFVGGVVMDPLDIFADGDFSLLHFDTSGRLLVNAEGLVDTDDDAIASGQETGLCIDLNYGFDGTNWRRFQSRAVSAVGDEALMHVLTRSAVMGYDATRAAGSRSAPIGSDTLDGVGGTAPASFQGLFTHSAVGGYDTDWAGAYRAARASDFNADTDVEKTLIGILVNSRMAAWDITAANWQYVTSLDVTGYTGAAANANNHLLTIASAFGIDNTGAAVLRPVEARNFDAAADVAAALIGLTTNSRMAALDTLSAWTQVRIGAANGTNYSEVGYNWTLVTAALRGIDSSAGVGSQAVPIEARDFNSEEVDAATTLIGLLTNSRLAGWRVGTNQWRALNSDVASSISGLLATTPNGIYANAITVGLDNTGAAVLRPVEARNFDSLAADVASTLIGLLTNSRCAYYDLSDGWTGFAGVAAASVTSTVTEKENGPFVYQARADEFAAARRGKRFYATHQTPGTLVTAQTGFVATTPTFMYRINSAAIRAILRSIDLSIQNTPGGVVYVTVAIDTADRYSAGGTAVTLQNSNEESATAAVGLFYFNPTATAAGGGTRYLGTWVTPYTPGVNINLDFGDGVLLGPTASTLLVYVWAASTAPDLTFVFDLEEVA